jgi:hypothetical protein
VVVAVVMVEMVEVNRPDQRLPAAIVRSQPSPVTVSWQRMSIVGTGRLVVAARTSQEDHRREESEFTHGLKVVGRTNGDKIILQVIPIT